MKKRFGGIDEYILWNISEPRNPAEVIGILLRLRKLLPVIEARSSNLVKFPLEISLWSFAQTCTKEMAHNSDPFDEIEQYYFTRAGKSITKRSWSRDKFVLRYTRVASDTLYNCINSPQSGFPAALGRRVH